jgi:hypothetical protein
MEEFIQIVEYNVFDMYDPKTYYLPLDQLSIHDVYTLRDADHRVYDQERHEADPLGRRVDEVVSKAMSVIAQKQEHIVKRLVEGQRWIERVVYTILPPEAFMQTTS